MNAAAGIGAAWVKRGFRIFFRLLVLASLGFVALAVQAQWPAVSAWRPSWPAAIALVSLALFYAGSLFLLAEIWHRLVCGLDAKSWPRAATFASFTKTQIAKYLPGNVFHLVGRHLWLTRYGIGQRVLVSATGLEAAILLAGAATAAGILAVARPLPGNAAFAEFLNPLAPWLIAGGLAFASAALAVRVFASGGDAARLAGVLLRALALAVVFFIAQAATFLAVSGVAGAEIAPEIGATVAAAWIVGFLTPGAPGGLGTREAVLLLALPPIIGEGPALIAIMLFRVVTTAGDVLCYALGELLWKTTPHQPSESGPEANL